MFTGIIEELGMVKKIVNNSRSIEITIQCKKILEDSKIGDSIAVNGICLTVIAIGIDSFTADVMPETVKKTGLQKLHAAQQVNLERALRLSDRLGGHIVSGHIDGEGTIINIRQDENAIWLTIKTPDHILKYIIKKGSVALDGVSLTIADISNIDFKVSLIPLTAKNTTLGSKNIHDKVNIECDMLGKYVEKMLQPKGNSISNLLKENGFL